MNSNGRTCVSGVFVRAAVGVALFLFFAQSTRAQTMVGTIPLQVSGEPWAVAVNPLTDKIYIVGGGISVIDGHLESTTSVPSGLEPVAVAVNPVTNKIYVANRGNWLKNIRGSVTVIDGVTNSTSTINVPPSTWPAAVAVNPETNKIYVANLGHSVTVIDGATNTATTLSINDSFTFNVGVVLNPVTDKIYVASAGSQSLWVIDGATNDITSVPILTAGASGPFGIAVNTVTNRNYVASGAVTMIDGDTDSTTRIIDPNAAGAGAVAVNPITNKIYVANEGDYPGTNHGNVTVIDGSTNSTTTVTDSNALVPLSIAVDSVSDRIYVTNANSSTLDGNGGVTIIDGATDSFATVIDPNAKTDLPAAIAVDPTTDRIYVANSISDNVTVIDGGMATPFSVAVRNVVGQTRTAATAAITDAGLVVGTVTQQASSKVVSGYVISASPAVGTDVASSSAVNLVVSSGDPSGGHGGGGGLDLLTLWTLMGCLLFAVRRLVALP